MIVATAVWRACRALSSEFSGDEKAERPHTNALAPLRRRGEIQVSALRIGIELAVLPHGRQAQFDDVLCNLVRRLECHGILPRHGLGAHSRADRPRLEKIDPHRGSCRFSCIGARQSFKRGFGDGVRAPISRGLRGNAGRDEYYAPGIGESQ